MAITMSAHRNTTQPFGRIIGTELIHGRPVRAYRRESLWIPPVPNSTMPLQSQDSGLGTRSLAVLVTNYGAKDKAANHDLVLIDYL